MLPSFDPKLMRIAFINFNVLPGKTSSVFSRSEVTTHFAFEMFFNPSVSDDPSTILTSPRGGEKLNSVPPQMFRETAHLLRDADVDVDFSLLSLWPINRHNVPKSSAEKKGLEFVRKNPNLKYYDKEKIGPQTFFVGVYPDNAVSTACVSCHNTHIKSPKRNFALGDNMGAIVIRIPISGS